MTKTTFKTSATRTTRDEIWAVTVDLLNPNPHPDDRAANAARAAIKDSWCETKTRLKLTGLTPDQLSYLASELEFWGDPYGFWDYDVMRSRRAFPRIAREIREHLKALSN